MDPLSLFCSYAHADEDLRDELARHLASLKRQGIIAEWHDRQIPAGNEWDGEIRQHLRDAEVVLLLISSDFLASDYCNDVEVEEAMRMHEAGDARVIPVILRPCDWKGTPFEKLQGVPKNAKPVTTWDNPDEAFLDITKALRRAAEAMRANADPVPGAPPPPTPPPASGFAPTHWNLPCPTQTFTGRQTHLDQIETALAAGDRVALTALAGLGGIGKTQIALEFARRHRDDYDIGWFIRAEEPGVMRSDLSALAVRLGLADPTAGPDATMAALRQWWATHDRWLLVYDNVEQADESLRDALPTDGRGHVLLTSRSQAWGGTAEKIRVGVLPRDEAVALLLRRAEVATPTDAQREAADRVADALGDLPLALEQAAAYVDEAGIAFDAYLDLFQQRRADLLAEGTLSTAYPDTVATTWSLAFEKAEAECPAAGGLLRLCACLAPDDIPADLIRQWDEPWPGPLDAVRTDQLVWTKALAALRRHSLVRTDAEGLSVHRLVQAVTFDRMTKAERETWVTAAQRFIHQAVDVNMQTMTTRLSDFDKLIPHALANANLTGGDEEVQAHIVDRAATFAQLRADYVEAEALFRRALAIGEATHGTAFPRIAYVNNLGRVLRDRGDLDGAEDAFRRALANWESTHGDNHPVVAILVSNIGGVLLDRGDLDGAEDAYRRAHAIGEAAYGTDHPQVAMYANNLGIVLRARGDLDGAEGAYRHALATGEVAYGADHPYVAVYTRNLGRVLQNRGDLGGAEDAYRRALGINETAYGPGHPEVAIDVANLGSLLQDRGDLDSAEDAFRRALDIFERKLGPDHPNTQIVRDHLASLRS